VSVGLRSVGIRLAFCFGIAVALSACGGSSSLGVLTSSDIPSDLGVQANESATAITAHRDGSERHCERAGIAVFTVPGGKIPKAGIVLNMITSASGTIVLSADYSCATPSDAHKDFKSDVRDAGRQIAGIGDEATLLHLSAPQPRYLLEWRKGNQIGGVLVVGPTKNKHITPALAELLARRAVARS
jgi:hypothetical protein